MQATNAKQIALTIILSLLFSGVFPAESKETSVSLPNPDNLIIEGVPPVPLNVVSDCEKYTHYRQAAVSSWHPTKKEMLINTRFSDTQQVHHVKVPAGARTQLTFYPDRVFGGTFQPDSGDYFLFNKDRGGDEFFQVYRYDTNSRNVTLITDGKSRNTSGRFSKDGKFYV